MSMTKSFLARFVLLYSLVVALITLTGCMATFRGNELSRIDQFSMAGPIRTVEPPSVGLTVTWHFQLSPLPLKKGNVPDFNDDVFRVAQQSGLFSSVSDRTDADYHIDIDMLNSGSWVLSTCLGTISGLTLTIIPSYARDNYTLTAVVTDARGTRLGDYRYVDHLNSWSHLFLLPFAPFTKHVGDDVRRNMLMHLFTDVGKAGICKPKSH